MFTVITEHEVDMKLAGANSKRCMCMHKAVFNSSQYIVFL